MRNWDGNAQAWAILSVCAMLSATIVGTLAPRVWPWVRAAVAGSFTGHEAEPPIVLDGLPEIPTDPTSWITSDDYPSDALRKGEQGRVRVELAFDGEGHAYDCRIAQSSGVPSLDHATCAAFLSRASLGPGTAGRTMERSVVWRLP